MHTYTHTSIHILLFMNIATYGVLFHTNAIVILITRLLPLLHHHHHWHHTHRYSIERIWTAQKTYTQQSRRLENHHQTVPNLVSHTHSNSHSLTTSHTLSLSVPPIVIFFNPLYITILIWIRGFELWNTP